MKMSKTLLPVIAIASLTLASCSSDEPSEAASRGRAIDFRSAISSRATETTNANLTDINVAAFLGNQLFFPVSEYSKGSDGFFTSATEYYWPGDDSELTFYAYAPAAPGNHHSRVENPHRLHCARQHGRPD